MEITMITRCILSYYDGGNGNAVEPKGSDQKPIYLLEL